MSKSLIFKSLIYFNYLICLFLLDPRSVMAQAPSKMSYQAVVRNGAGDLVINSPIGVRISVLQGSSNGTAVYSETYTPNPQTNAQGLLSFEVGSGTPQTGTFNNINWAAGPYFIRTEVDITGGSNYQVLGSQQLLSVPYALHAERSNGITLPLGMPSTNGQLYYCNGQLQLTPCPLVIGQMYAGGYIFYLDSSGLNGLVCAPTDVGTYPWNCFGNITGTDTSIGSGQANTLAILNSCTQASTAAKVCADWIFNGYDDWYLPSQGELSLIVQNLVLPGITSFHSNAGAAYWSSSQVPFQVYGNSGHAWGVNMANGNVFTNAKQALQGVRAIRSFSSSCNPCKPNITTLSIRSITSNSAETGGNVISDGGSRVTSKGVVFDSIPNPTLSSRRTTNGTGSGTYVSQLTSLSPSRHYFVRAYATNSVGTSYGNEVSFFTQTSNGFASCGSVSDIDGNTYQTVQIGTQCWLQENLKSVRYQNGDSIPEVPSFGSNAINIWANSIIGVYTTSWNSAFGNLYKGYTVLDPRGICPTGWHVGSDAEWSVLSLHLDSLTNSNAIGIQSQIAGKNLKSTSFWNSPNIADNSSGFTALPAHYRYVDGNYHGSNGTTAAFWTKTQYLSNDLYFRTLNNNTTELGRFRENFGFGYSIRCLRDTNYISTSHRLPVISTDNPSYLGSGKALVGGSISSDGGTTIISKGILFSTIPSPLYADTSTFGSGLGAFQDTLHNLNINQDYYIWAFATNSVGTSYGLQKKIHTLALGDSFAGGYVFYIDSTNSHGLVCTQLSQGWHNWGCDNLDIQGTSSTFGTGLNNTNLILSNCIQRPIAASVCADLTLNGYDDWYLPSSEELLLAYLNLRPLGLGNFQGPSWTSTQVSPNLAHDVNTSGGFIGVIGQGWKYQQGQVRPIRAF